MSYSSYAQRGRFDPIQVGDKTQEMVRSSSKYLDAMRDNNRIDISQKKELLQAIKRKNEQERINRDQNFELEEKFKRTAREQELANYKTEINNVETEKRESEAMFSSIMEFSTTLQQKVQDYNKEKSEAETNYDYLLIQRVGLDNAEELLFGQQEAQMGMGEAATNDAVESATQAGLSQDQIDHIRNSSGARRVNLMNQLLRDKADALPLHISENQNTPISLLNEDGSTTEESLNGALEKGDMDLYSRLYDQVESKYLLRVSKELPNQGAFYKYYGKAAESTRQRLLLNASEKIGETNRKRYEEERKDTLFVNLTTGFENNDYGRLQLEIEKSTDRPGIEGQVNRRQHLTTILGEVKERIEAGTLPDAREYVQFLGDNFFSEGIFAGKTLAEIPEFQDDYTALQRALADYEKDEMNRQNDSDKVRKFEQLSSIEEWATTEWDGNIKSLQYVMDELQTKHGHDAEDLSSLTHLLSRSQQGANKKAIEDNFTSLLSQGLLTEDHLKTPGIPIETRQTFTSALKQQQEEFAMAGVPQRSKINSSIKEKLRGLLKADSTESTVDDSITRAYFEAVKMFDSNLKRLNSESNDLTGNYMKAIDLTFAQIESEKDKEGSRFHVTPSTDAANPYAYFTSFKVGPNNMPPALKDQSQLLRGIANDPQKAVDEYLIDISSYDRIDQAIQQGRPPVIPKFLHEAAAIAGMPVKELVNKKLKKFGYETEIGGSLEDRFNPATLDPTIRRLLGTRTVSGINAAINLTGNTAPSRLRTGADGYVDAVNLGRHVNSKFPMVVASSLKLSTDDFTNFNSRGTRPEARLVEKTAANLGINASDLMAVISYETAGTFDPSKFGGLNGQYMGLIQFGPDEREQYGAYPGQSFAEQLGAVERFLTDRFSKAGRTTQGATLTDLYATINGGNPNVSLGLSDGNGTIAEHIANIDRDHRSAAHKYFYKGGGSPMQNYRSKYEQLKQSGFEDATTIREAAMKMPNGTLVIQDLIQRGIDVDSEPLPVTDPKRNPNYMRPSTQILYRSQQPNFKPNNTNYSKYFSVVNGTVKAMNGAIIIHAGGRRRYLKMPTGQIFDVSKIK